MQTTVYEPPERFVRSLHLTFLTHLLDSDVYLESGDTGYGIFELERRRMTDERRRFQPIVEWVKPETADAAPRANVVPLAHDRFGYGGA